MRASIASSVASRGCLSSSASVSLTASVRESTASQRWSGSKGGDAASTSIGAGSTGRAGDS